MTQPCRPAMGQTTGLTTALVIAMAAGVQILTTLPVIPAGLRVALSDLVLLAFLPILAVGLRDRLVDRAILAWLVALVLVLVLALGVNWHGRGTLSLWGLSKIVGFPVLILYFLAGAWIARTRQEVCFVRSALVAAWVIAALSFVTQIVFSEMQLFGRPNWFYTRLIGLSDNPNAYGFLIATLLVLQFPLLKRRDIFSPLLHGFGFGLGLFALFLAASRSSYLAAAAGLAIVAWPCRRDLVSRLRLPVLVFGGLLLLWQGLLFAESLLRPTGEYSPTGITNQAISTQLVSTAGVEVRIETARRALALWFDNPVLGLGLGSWLDAEMALGHAEVTTLHATGLWLLVETGVVGFLVFAAFFAVLVRRFASSASDPYVLAALGLIGAFGLGSIGTELLYQRQLWLILGLGVGMWLRLQERPA